MFVFAGGFFLLQIPLEGVLISSLFVANGRLFFFGWLFFQVWGGVLSVWFRAYMHDLVSVRYTGNWCPGTIINFICIYTNISILIYSWMFYCSCFFLSKFYLRKYWFEAFFVALVNFCFCWWFFPLQIPLEGVLIWSLFVAFGRLFFGWLLFPSRAGGGSKCMISCIYAWFGECEVHRKLMPAHHHIIHTSMVECYTVVAFSFPNSF